MPGMVSYFFLSLLIEGEAALKVTWDMTASITHLVKCRSLASMLRCLMHIRVKAEPMSLVAPRKTGITKY